MGQPRPLLSFIFGVVKVKIGMWEDIETETTVNCDRPSILFFNKMGQPRPLLSFIFGLFKQTS